MPSVRSSSAIKMVLRHYIYILGIELELACNGGSCRGISLK